MQQHWRSILLSLSAASFLFSACNKQMSSDTALPASYYPSIIINNDNQVVYAFDPTNGNKNWELDLYTPPTYLGLYPTVPIIFTPSPLLYNESVYLAYTQRDPSKTDTVFKVNARTGKLIAKILPNKNELFNIQATPIANGHLLYVAGTNGKLYAIDTGTLATEWEFSANGPIISSPTIYGNNLYFATTVGTIYCIDQNLGPTGTANWSYCPVDSPRTLSPIASFYSSPAVSPPYLYIGSVTDSNMYCIFLNNPTTSALPFRSEIERWRFKTNGPIYSSPAAYAGTCIFGCGDFHIYCLDTTINSIIGTSPQTRWVDSAHSSVFSSPYVYNQVVYIGSHDYYLYALNIINGSVKWQFKSNGLIKSSPIAYNGNVYIGSYDKSLYALDTTNGKMRWFKNTNGEIEDSPVIDDITGNSYNSGISGYSNGSVTSLIYTFNMNNF